MFKFIARRAAARIIARLDEMDQHELDCLRNQYAADPAMQLHFDRMQTALSAQ